MILGLVAWSAVFAATSEKRVFNVSADTAEKSLKRFSQQAGVEVLFPTGIARQVRTQAVRGEMTPKDALSTMLADTGLVIIQDARTQAFSIRQETESEKKTGERYRRHVRKNSRRKIQHHET